MTGLPLLLMLAAGAAASSRQAGVPVVSPAGSPVVPAVASPALPAVPPSLAVPVLPAVAVEPLAVPSAEIPEPQSPTRTLQAMDQSLDRRQLAAAQPALNHAYDNAASPQSASPVDSGAGAALPPSDAGLTSNGRLPGNVTPKSYEIRARFEPAKGTFTGRAAIKAKIERRSTHIVLHALDLEVTRATVGGRPLPAAAIKVDKEKEIVILELPQAAEQGETTIELEYSGKLNTQMRGPYQSGGTHEGKDEKYVFSHFEPTNARRLAPMFDEPNLKAVFQLTVDVPAELTAISNMPAARREVQGDRQIVAFKPSPKMSSYLLAVYAARLVPAAKKKVAGVDVTIWTAPGQEKQAAFAMKAAEQSIRRLNEYFGLPYDLPKLDLVAASDFASGAMENWGAILFRDSALLVDPKLSSTRAKRRVGVVVIHEIVHQWFGDLVTMDWWDDLWLNEAFATWLSYKVGDEWLPEWKLWLEFEQGKKSPLSIDALRSTRAIASNAVSSAEIQAMFDPLTYDKGGSILRMLEAYLGETKFRAGLRLYMKRHKYGNAKAADLWRALEDASGQPVTRVADAWVKTPGYPIVEASRSGARKVLLSQRRFLSERGQADATTWVVPVVLKYKLKGEARPRTLKLILDSKEKSVELPGKGRLEWAYTNAGETGFYRAGLAPDLLAPLLAAGPKTLTPAEKVGLLGHLWAQAKNGERPISDLLDALSAFKGDKDRTVLEEVTGYLRSIDDTFRPKGAEAERLAALARELLGAHLKRLGVLPKKGEDDEAKLARAAVVGTLSAIGRSQVLDTALETSLEHHLEDPSKTDPALVTTLLVAGARHGDAARFDAYVAGMRSATTPERRDQFLRALSEFRDPALARRSLDLALSDDLRPQDAWKPAYFALTNAETQAVAWAWIQANWAALKEKVGPRGASQVIGAVSSLQSAEWRAEVAAFFAKPENAVPIAAKKLAQSLDAIDVALKFKADQSEPLKRWLAR